MDFDLGGMLSGLFGGGQSPADPTDPTDPTKLTAGGANPNSPVLGWLNKNSGNLAQAGQGVMAMQQKQQPQVAPLQLQMAQAPQHQAPQMNFGTLMPFAPAANPMTGR
jgi:hypothetical protein